MKSSRRRLRMLGALLTCITGCGAAGEAAYQTGEAGIRTLLDLLLTDLANQVADGFQPEQPPPDDGDEDDPLADGIASLSTEVQPVFDAHCTICHAPGRSADLQGIPLDLRSESAYERLVGQPSVQSGDLMLVVPGEPEASLLFLAISSDSPPIGIRMPKGRAPLSDAQVELIRQWILQGAEDN